MKIRIFRALLISVLILSTVLSALPQVPTQVPAPAQVRGVEVLRFVEPTGDFRDVTLYDSSQALVIGMSNYDKWDDLEGPVKDVEEVRNVLTEHGFNVQVEKDLTGEQLENKINQFLKKHGNSGKKRIIIYFAGHGATFKPAQEQREMGFIVPVDAPLYQENEAEFLQKALSMEKIKGFAADIKTTHALFIFDSCFSGMVTRSVDTKAIPPAIGIYLENSARQFITSGSAKQKVPDQSIFKDYFVRGLRGSADTNRDGYITGLELYQYLYNNVTNESKKNQALQTPQYGTIQDSNFKYGDMVFFLTRKPSDISEEQAWLIAKNENTSESYTIFLNSFPNGKYYNEAIGALVAASKKTVPGKLPADRPTTETSRGQSYIFKPFEFITAALNGSGNVDVREKVLINSIEEDLGDGIKMKLVRIPGGKFRMGSEKSPEEKPVHDVSVPEFHMGIMEVTKKQWEAVNKMPKVNILLPKNPIPRTSADNMPIANIAWEEAEEFCNRLSRFTKKRYSLPSEAEWEFAARAESNSMFAFGSKLNPEFFNFDAQKETLEGVKGIFRNQAVEVGSLGLANKYGLFDMYGNVAEWCQDDWADTYENAPTDGTARLSGNRRKVIRGGSFSSLAKRLCSTCRNGEDLSSEKIGFRVVMRSPVIYPNT